MDIKTSTLSSILSFILHFLILFFTKFNTLAKKKGQQGVQWTRDALTRPERTGTVTVVILVQTISLIGEVGGDFLL